MTNDQRIYLIGPMGAGKTTIGRMVARELDYTFVDSDHEIEQRTGVDISTIFDYEEECGFRDRESDMLSRLSRLKEHVVATGGGAILREENRELMQKTGFVVYLTVSIRQAIIRTKKDTKRPILNQGDPHEIFTRLAAERNPLYETLADFTVNTDKHRTSRLRDIITSGYRKHLATTEQKSK